MEFPSQPFQIPPGRESDGLRMHTWVGKGDGCDIKEGTWQRRNGATDFLFVVGPELLLTTSLLHSLPGQEGGSGECVGEGKRGASCC